MDLRTVLLEPPADFPLDGVLLVTGTLAPFRRLHRMAQHYSQLLHLDSVSILVVPILVATGITFTLHSIRFPLERAHA